MNTTSRAQLVNDYETDGLVRNLWRLEEHNDFFRAHTRTNPTLKETYAAAVAAMPPA